MKTLLEQPGALGPGGLCLPPSVSFTFDHVTEDSRRVRPGSIFVAVSGERYDGHEFADSAREHGAVAIAGECEGIDELEDLPYLRFNHARRGLGILAHALAGDPSARMTVIGVTGTNGKSSTVAILAHLLHAAGHRCASFGTLGYTIGEDVQDAPHTTPFGETLAELFAGAERAGCTHVVMEASSHAIDQDRIAGIAFGGAVFTNLTQDHLDYHEDLDQYRASKIALFARIPEDGFCVVNLDDPSAPAFATASGGHVHTYGAAGDVHALAVSTSEHGTRFALETPWGKACIETPLIGGHNVSNILAATTAACAMGVEIETIASALSNVPPIPGRFEQIDCGQDFKVVVDYAHTDDGLRNVLAAARPLCEGTLITVFGCGGDRDKTKRPSMARAVADGGDFAIVTSDNPRTEDPERILLDIEVGMQRAGKRKGDDYLVFIDRREAIRHALAMAETGDFVLIAGKGHEDYQILGTEKIHFDDREIVREILAELRGAGS